MHIAVECNKLPIPTNGVQILPPRKVIEPIAAEAEPAFSRSLSNAKAVEEGNSNPKKNKTKIRLVSKYKKGRLKKRQKPVVIEKMSIPTLPTIILFLGCSKRMERAEPITILKEFKPKKRLNIKAEKP